MLHRYRLADLPVRKIPFAGLPYARGYIERMAPQSTGGLRVSGWIIDPGRPLDAIDVLHDGHHLFTSRLFSRPDVKEVFKWLPHCESSGFDFELPPPGARQICSRLDLVAVNKNQQRVRMSQLVRTDVDEFPCPSEPYMYRVSHVRNAHTFRVGGLKTLGDFFEAFARHRDIAKTRSILDWGCGFGRMAMFFLAAGDCPGFCGCDIDPQAVAWCNQHLRSGAFSVLDLMPPTPYRSAQFDFICSYSVLTHLTREAQRVWLKEMHRVLAPGGLLIATTHGRLAFSFARGRRSVWFPLCGIVDASRDDTLDAIAPAGYYRSTYQSRRYTLREFGRFFSVLEYVERGAGNFQDLIVVTK